MNVPAVEFDLFKVYKKALLKDKDIKHNENLFFIECLEELKKDKN